MLRTIAIILSVAIFLPIFFQVIIGNKSKKKKIALSFGYVTLISVFSQLLITFLFYLSFSYTPNPNNYDWGLGGLFIVGLSALFFIMILIVSLIQTI